MLRRKIPYGGGYLGKGIILLVLFLAWNLCPLLLSPAFAQGQEAGEPGTFWLWQFFGRLHPLMVHFPLSFLLLAAVLELFTLKDFHSKLRPGINLMVYVGAGSAVLAVILGLLLATIEDYGGDILSIHQWAGLATAVLGLITLLLLTLIENKHPK